MGRTPALPDRRQLRRHRRHRRMPAAKPERGAASAARIAQNVPGGQRYGLKSPGRIYRGPEMGTGQPYRSADYKRPGRLLPGALGRGETGKSPDTGRKLGAASAIGKGPKRHEGMKIYKYS